MEIRPRGFTLAFLQASRDLVKNEVFSLFREFLEHGTLTMSLNTTFLVLIPKKGGAESLGDFRLISLVGSLYKVLAKVLANRQKKVVGNVVSKAHNALCRGAPNFRCFLGSYCDSGLLAEE